MAVFRFEHVTVDGTPRPPLRDVTADLPADGVTVVAGPSGAGKSTLLRLCNRLEVPTEGRVLWHGADVAGLDPLELRRRVGMVFQRPTLFGGTVLDNLHVADGDLGVGEAAELLARVELPPGFFDRRADELSGGEAQRVCLARALAAGPEVLLMDEPTSALDQGPRRALERLARGLADDGMPVLWVTHDLRQLRRLADHVVVLVEGTLRWAGPLADLAGCTDPHVTAFLAHDEPGEAPSAGG